MATVFGEPEAHPVAALVTRSHTDLDELGDPRLWSMADADLAETLASVAALRHRLTGLELSLAREAERRDLGPVAGATDTASWWAHTTRQTKRTAHHRMELAQALDRDHERVWDAMAAGRVSEVQAVVIVKGVDALPVEHRGDAEAHLVGLAAEHDPVALGRLAAHILEVVAPEVADAHERAALERQEALAVESCRFTMSDDGHGLCHGRFTVPSVVGAMLKQGVLAINSPKHRRHSGTPKGMGHAFCEYVTRYPLDRLPHAGGVDATVVVTMTLEQLEGRLETSGIARLDTGDPLTADHARQLACEARIIPIVLGGRGEILDQGRAKRFHTKAQRIAIAHRDHHCTAEHCDWPAAMCHVHHNTPWSKGGTTTVADGRLLCPRHHTYAHSPKYQMKTIPNGRVIFSRS